MTNQGSSDNENEDVVVGAVRRPHNGALHFADSIHDDATANRLGFRGGLVAGSVHFDQFPPLALDIFGSKWFETGSLSLYFKHATTDQEPVQAFMVRPSRVENDSQTRAWMKTEDGTELISEGTASVGSPSEPSALFSRDLRGVDPSSLRILKSFIPGEELGDWEVTVDGDRQNGAQSTITEPLEWYYGESPWGGPIATPSNSVHLLAGNVIGLVNDRTATVGLFGAVELRYWAGPVLIDHTYEVQSKVVAVTETPQTEALWYDSRASEDGVLVASMRMMLRKVKAASPLYETAG